MNMETAWKCTKCSRTLRRNTDLKKHMKVLHELIVLTTGADPKDSPNFLCPHCDNNSSNKHIIMEPHEACPRWLVCGEGESDSLGVGGSVVQTLYSIVCILNRLVIFIYI